MYTLTDEALEQIVAERAEQGLPAQLEDPVAIEKIVTIIEESRRRRALAR